MGNLVENLEKYFNETPLEQVIKDWEATAKFENVGPTLEEFMNNNPFLNDKKFLLSFNEEMVKLYHWFLPADEKMIDEFLRKKYQDRDEFLLKNQNG